MTFFPQDHLLELLQSSKKYSDIWRNFHSDFLNIKENFPHQAFLYTLFFPGEFLMHHIYCTFLYHQDSLSSYFHILHICEYLF